MRSHCCDRDVLSGYEEEPLTKVGITFTTFLLLTPYDGKSAKIATKTCEIAYFFARPPPTMLRCHTLSCDYVPVLYDFSCGVSRPHATTSGEIGVVCDTRAQ